MREIRYRSTAWDAPVSHIVPSENLTPNEQKRLAARERLIDDAMTESKKPRVWMRINHGIYKGTIFSIDPRDRHVTFRVSVDFYAQRTTSAVHYHQVKGKDASKKWTWADRKLEYQFGFNWRDPKPLKVQGNWIIPTFLETSVTQGIGMLLDYEGEEVFCIDGDLRPPVFTDRLDQEVNIGDLVVVALNQGAGLDICIVRGFADEERVAIESVEDGSFERIVLKDNATNKIMRMPNSLRDTALMMKLARS